MLQIREFYTAYLQYWFFSIYTLLTVSILYFLVKRLVLWILDRYNIEIVDNKAEFFIKFFIPAVISLAISFGVWCVIQILSDDVLAVFSIIYIGWAGVWWYDYPLKIKKIRQELTHFSEPIYYLCRLILLTIFYTSCALAILVAVNYTSYLLGF